MMLVVIGLAGLIAAGLVAGRQLSGWLGRETRRLEAAPLRDGLADAAWSGMLEIRDARSRDLIDYWDDYARTGRRPVAARHGRRRAESGDGADAGSLALSLMAALVAAEELPVGTPARRAWRLLEDRAPTAERAGELNGVIDRAKQGRRSAATRTPVGSFARSLAGLLFGRTAAPGRRSVSMGEGRARIPRQRGGEAPRVLHALRPPKVDPVIRKPAVARVSDSSETGAVVEPAWPSGSAEVGMPADSLLARQAVDIDLTEPREQETLDLDALLAGVPDLVVSDAGDDAGPDADEDLDLDTVAATDLFLLPSGDCGMADTGDIEAIEDIEEAGTDDVEDSEVDGPEVDGQGDPEDRSQVPESERPTQQIQRIRTVAEPSASPAVQARTVDLRDTHFTPGHS